MTISLEGRVAIVTGAGGGLGRAHALALARRGAKVVVNDVGSARDGSGGGSGAAEGVAAEIRAAGGTALADAASVTDWTSVTAMVGAAMAQWGRIDILVSNAGILRDKTFAKMDLADFRAVLEVHLMGAVHCTKAIWEIMRTQNYGRICLTTSSSGLFGNFGQSNYGAAKMALVGLMQTLGLEGARHGIRVNCLAPTATTRMTEDIFAADRLAQFTPESVANGLLHLVSDDAPNRAILCAGAGSFERAYISMTRGIFVGAEDDAAERVAAGFAALSDRTGDSTPENAGGQGAIEIDKLAAHRL